MKFLWNKKDGGLESHVWMYGFESKTLGSLLLLRFEDGSREAYHNHAFHALSWALTGGLIESHLSGRQEVHTPSIRPILTTRDTFHRVFSMGRSWILTFRGPWSAGWSEYVPGVGTVTLEQGRRVVDVFYDEGARARGAI